MLHLQCSQCETGFDAEPDVLGNVSCPKCNTSFSVYDVDFDLPQGYTIGGFEVIRLVGRGGMGNVYLANQVSMQRTVALKVLLKNQTRDKTSLMQFLNEVKTLGRIQHQSIVTAFDAGEDNGLFYLAMQFVDGVTLEDRIDKDGPMLEDLALEYIITVAKAIKYVWDKFRMFHRDIKPGNIMINEDDEAMLLDMGIAQSRGDSSLQQGKIEGSPYYMSPEQIRGDSLTWSTDLYSLGATFFHLIVGVPPFDDKEDITKILEKHLNDPFPSPASRNPKVKISPQVVTLIKKMMEKDPAKRFTSWDAFISAAEKTLQSFDENTSRIKRLDAKKQKRLQIKKNSSIYVPRKKTSSIGPVFGIINILIFVAIGIVVAFYFVSKNNTNAARNLFESAARISKDPDQAEESLRYLFQAKAVASKFGVDQNLRQDISDAIARMKPVVQNRTQEQTAVNAAVSAAAQEIQTLQRQLDALQNNSSDDLSDALDTIRAKAREVIATLSRIPISSPANKNTIEFTKGSIDTLLSRCNTLEKGVRSKMKAQEDSAAAEELKEKQSEELAEYAKLVDQFKHKTRASLVAAVRRSDFQSTDALLQFPDDLWKNEAHFTRSVTQLRNWLNLMKEYRDRAKQASDKIKAANVDPQKPLTDAQISSAFSGQNDLLVSYFMLNGKFDAAEKVVDELDREELHAVLEAYVSGRIRSALNQSKKGDESFMKQVETEFGSLPEFPRLKSEMMQSSE